MTSRLATMESSMIGTGVPPSTVMVAPSVPSAAGDQPVPWTGRCRSLQAMPEPPLSETPNSTGNVVLADTFDVGSAKDRSATWGGVRSWNKSGGWFGTESLQAFAQP